MGQKEINGLDALCCHLIKQAACGGLHHDCQGGRAEQRFLLNVRTVESTVTDVVPQHKEK